MPYNRGLPVCLHFHKRKVHVGIAVESHQQLHDLLAKLNIMNIPTAGIEFDPDGQSDYVCFRDPDNIQIEFYVGDYHD